MNRIRSLLCCLLCFSLRRFLLFLPRLVALLLLLSLRLVLLLVLLLAPGHLFFSDRSLLLSQLLTLLLLPLLLTLLLLSLLLAFLLLLLCLLCSSVSGCSFYSTACSVPFSSKQFDSFSSFFFLTSSWQLEDRHIVPKEDFQERYRNKCTSPHQRPCLHRTEGVYNTYLRIYE
jgi:hypothetical protein